jgi:deferrochelatase/peroxidase EfeB
VTLANLQGNVIFGHGSNFTHYIFGKVTDPAAARAWLDSRLDHITYNDSWERNPPEHTLNVAFTHTGLLATGAPEQSLRAFGGFTQGMSVRAAELGDVGAESPENWQPELRDPHLVVIVGAWRAEMLQGVRAELEEQLTGSGNGLELSCSQAAAVLPDAREHFGFGDGFSQPAIAGANTGPRDGEGTLTRWRGWKEPALGEFVLGYADEGGQKPAAPEGALGADATFMVIRKLKQDVARFRRYVREQARRFGRGENWIAAKMVGRWHNGSPLASYPDRPGPIVERDAREHEPLPLRRRPRGKACPLGAHVRILATQLSGLTCGELVARARGR